MDTYGICKECGCKSQQLDSNGLCHSCQPSQKIWKSNVQCQHEYLDERTEEAWESFRKGE